MRSSLVKTATDAVQAAVDFIMPLVCVHCGTESSLLCTDCIEDANKVPDNVCRTCAAPTAEYLNFCGDCIALPPPLDRLVPAYRYGGAVRSAVHALKYRHMTAIATVMGELMAEHKFFRRAKLDCVVPVPVHKDRLRERGYNQAALLARSVADNIELQYISDALTKTRATASQVELTWHERSLSLTNAFVANYDFEDAHVLLVDDVSTSGNTLMNCAVALKRAGARRVSGLVFAKEGDGESAEVEYQSSPTRSRYSST